MVQSSVFLKQDRSPEDPQPPPPAGAKLQTVRWGTVCGRYRNGSYLRVSDLRLCGLWLKGAGFDIGQKYEARVDNGRLTARVTTCHPRSRRSNPTGKHTARQRVRSKRVTRKVNPGSEAVVGD